MDRHAFKNVEVSPMLAIFLRHRANIRWVPHNDVCITSLSNAAFSWEDVQHLGSSCARHLNKASWFHLLPLDRLRPDQSHSLLCPGHPLRNGSEVILTSRCPLCLRDPSVTAPHKVQTFPILESIDKFFRNILSLPERRTGHKGSSVAPALVEIVASIHCKRRAASLPEDGQSTGLVLRDDGDDVRTGGSADDEGHVGGESKRAGSSHCLLLNLLGLGSRVTFRASYTSCEQAALVLCDDVPVLSVHLCHSTNVFDMLERLHELSIVEHQPTFLGHEQLEAVHPQLLCQLLHVAPCLIINLWDSNSKSKVAASRVLPGLFPHVERLHQAVPPLRHHQVHQGGRSTCNCCF